MKLSVAFGLCLALSAPALAQDATQMEAAKSIGAIHSSVVSGAGLDLDRLAQATQPQVPSSQAPPPKTPSTAPATNDEPIGNVVTLIGSATFTRNNSSRPLKLKDDIFKNDILQTSANSTLGITFNDATTFNLTANARIAVDNFVYDDSGKQNAALYNVAKGTVAFVAAAVAKTGNMKISTPTATLGIRGTTGLVEVPEGANTPGANDVAIKLYPDQDGKVGRIEISGRDGARLGSLTQGTTGFAIRPGSGGTRFAAVPLTISPLQASRDLGIVQQVHAAQTVGRQIVTQQRALRRANPAGTNPARQPGLPQQNGPPKQNQAPTQPAQPHPGEPLQPGLQKQPNTPGLQPPAGQIRRALPRRPAPTRMPRRRKPF
jgi:hypothetical protein